MTRWTFADPSTSESYTFIVNPNAEGSPVVKKTVTPLPLTASDGVQVMFEGRANPTTIEWTGVTLDESQYAAVVTWFGRRHQLQLTDDLARTTSIYITDFSSTRAAHRQHPWRLTYTVKAVLLSSQTQNLIPAADSEFELGTHSWAITNGFTTMAIVAAPLWVSLGTHSLQLVANNLPHNNTVSRGINFVRHVAGVTVQPLTAYRVRLRFLIYPEAQPTTSLGVHGRQAQVWVNWKYTDGAAVVHDLGFFGVGAQAATEVGVNASGAVISIGPVGGQYLGGVVSSPAMPAGGVTMHGYLEVGLLTGDGQVVQNGAYVLFGDNDPITVDTLYFDSVQFSR